MPATEHPEHTTLSPGELETVREFVNTYDFEREDPEALGHPDDLGDWLTDHGLAPAGVPVRPVDLRRAQEVREALRALLHANNGRPLPDESPIDVLNRAAGRAKVGVVFDADGGWDVATAAGGVDQGIGGLLAIVARAMSDGTWPRLKACGDDGCQWAFYDNSKNRSGRWCKMAACGNRAKARAFRERQRAGSARKKSG